MARSGSYDDLSDNRVSRRGNRSSKILLAVILLSILICAIAVLCWVKILETQEVAKANQASTVEQKPAETPVAEAKADVQDDKQQFEGSKDHRSFLVSQIGERDAGEGVQSDRHRHHGDELCMIHIPQTARYRLLKEHYQHCK